jgi:REP element-mobilizing transposase RayT
MSWDALRYFNHLAETQVTTNRLPHWNQTGASYFVTFRLADSLPSHLIHELKSQRTEWITCHPQPWDSKTESEYHRLFSAKVDRWLDAGHGECLLKQVAFSEIVSTVFHHFDRDRYLLHSFVIMPNHVHLLFTIAKPHTIPSIVQSWKRYSSREINKVRDSCGAFWQRDYFDRMIRDPQHFIRVVRYIRNNLKQYAPALHYESQWIKGLE